MKHPYEAPRGLYFDKQARPLDMMQWGELLEDDDYKRVALDVYPNIEDVAHDPLDGDPLVTVSTVWIGIDHAFGATIAPVIFETMIFGGEHDNECWRYCTQEQALEGHRQILACLREQREPCVDVDEEVSELND